MEIPLRVCRRCGLSVFSEEDLSLFVKAKRYKYKRIPLCKNCANELSQIKRDEKKEKTTHLRKCRFCGLEANKEEELILFRKNKRSNFGRDNLCNDCANSFSRIGGKYHEKKAKRSKLRQKITNGKKIRFNNKRIYFPNIVRTNICSKCGKSYPKELKTQTHIHHLEYDENDPLAHTIELCCSCHQKLHRKIEREKMKC